MANPLDLVFGQKPDIAKPKKTILADEQSKAIGSNISAFPQTAELGNLYSSYLQGAIEKQLPDYKTILAEGSTTTKDILAESDKLIKGELPQDVIDQIQRSSAYTSLMSGTAGSGMSKALTARDLGLTSLDLMSQGTKMAQAGGNAAQNWAKIAGSTTYDPNQMMVTPAQQASITANNNALMQAYQQFKFNVAAAPDPGAAGVSNTIMGVVGAYLGGSSATVQGGKVQNYNQGATAGIPANTNEPWQTNATDSFTGFEDSSTTNYDFSGIDTSGWGAG